MITLGALNDIGFLRHAFFTREGGVSQGIYRSLNCGFGSRDAPAAVAENRARAMAWLEASADRLVTLNQVHGNQVIVAESPWSPRHAPKADGLVTATPGLVLGILSADCAPVLFADPQAPIIGACHAGWRGAKAGVVEATIAAMVALGAAASRIVAVIGPCIAQRSYEVGPEFHAGFLAESADNARFFAPARRPGHVLFDLPGYIAGRLVACGVARVERTPCDTVMEADRFFSYRRATLNGEPDYGRMLSAIVLQP